MTRRIKGPGIAESACLRPPCCLHSFDRLSQLKLCCLSLFELAGEVAHSCHSTACAASAIFSGTQSLYAETELKAGLFDELYTMMNRMVSLMGQLTSLQEHTLNYTVMPDPEWIHSHTGQAWKITGACSPRDGNIPQTDASVWRHLYCDSAEKEQELEQFRISSFIDLNDLEEELEHFMYSWDDETEYPELTGEDSLSLITAADDLPY